VARRSLPGTSYYRPSSLDFPSILRARFMDGANYGDQIILFTVHTTEKSTHWLCKWPDRMFRSRFTAFRRTKLEPGKASDVDIRRTSIALQFFFTQQRQSEKIIAFFQTLPSLSQQQQLNHDVLVRRRCSSRWQRFCICPP
jgi:uncharacterized protein YodC (DUF2158 family)